MKAVVWLVYPLLFWRKRISNIRDFIGFGSSTSKKGYQWGSVATAIWVILSLGIIAVARQHFIGVDSWSRYLYIITLTPFFEEAMFRGFIVSGMLSLKVDGKIVNVLTTLLFLAVHIIGWAFQGVLIANLGSTAWLSIVLFSLVAGFIRIHSGSLRSSILLHMGNNALAGLFG